MSWSCPIFRPHYIMHCIDVAYCCTCHTFHDLCVCVYIVHTVEPCKNAWANGAVVCMQFDPRLSWCPPFLFYSKFSDYSHSWWQQIKRYTGQLKPCELNCLANGYLKQLADAANSLLRLPAAEWPYTAIVMNLCEFRWFPHGRVHSFGMYCLLSITEN